MDKRCNHIAVLNKVIQYAYEKEYENLMSCIEENYFDNKIFPSEYYLYGDDFIYRMDVTELSYGAVLELAYLALVKEDYRQFLLGLKIVYAKLKGNQRYTYYDRDRFLELSKELSTNYGVERLKEDPVKVPELLLYQGMAYLPIGFEEMDLKTYLLGSTRSFYDRYPSLEDKLFVKEYQSAVDQGNIYHHIVEIDHYINRENNTLTKAQWVHLAKLLSAHYATEKAPWSRDLTTSLLRIYLGLKDCCGQEEFEELLVQLVTGTLRIVLKKLSSSNQSSLVAELSNVINYMINVYLLENNNKFLDYIFELINVMNKETSEQEFLFIKSWIKEQITEGIGVKDE